MTGRTASSASFEVWVRRAAWVGASLCVPLLLVDRVRLGHPDFHPHFDGERWFGFYAGLSLVSCLALAAAAKIWQVVVTTAEDERHE
jgi:hypothetical protein